MGGLNLYDFSARSQDPTLGRFTTVDPKAEKYYSISPYAYCAGNPMNVVDPTGMAYHYVYSNEEKEEKGGYYVNDDGEKVEWKEVYQWLTANNDNKTDQDDVWGTITIFGNPGDGNTSSAVMGSSRFGHSWLKLDPISDNNGTEEMTFGTFKKGVAQENSDNPGKTFQTNFEKNNLYEAYINASKTKFITNKQRLLFDLINQLNGMTNWALTYNCTDYAVDMWNAITKDKLYVESGIRTPTILYDLLRKYYQNLKQQKK